MNQNVWDVLRFRRALQFRHPDTLTVEVYKYGLVNYPQYDSSTLQFGHNR